MRWRIVRAGCCHRLVLCFVFNTGLEILGFRVVEAFF